MERQLQKSRSLYALEERETCENSFPNACCTVYVSYADSFIIRKHLTRRRVTSTGHRRG